MTVKKYDIEEGCQVLESEPLSIKYDKRASQENVPGIRRQGMTLADVEEQTHANQDFISAFCKLFSDTPKDQKEWNAAFALAVFNLVWLRLEHLQPQPRQGVHCVCRGAEKIE